MRDAKGHTYGYGVEAGAMMLYAGRGDLIEKAGLAMPTTMDELIKVCDAVHGKGGVAAWTADKLHHWNWPPYLMGIGGRIFKDPPANLTPDAGYAGGGEVGAMVRRPDHEIRPVRHPVLHRRPGVAVATLRPRQHAHATR